MTRPTFWSFAVMVTCALKVSDVTELCACCACVSSCCARAASLPLHAVRSGTTARTASACRTARMFRASAAASRSASPLRGGLERGGRRLDRPAHEHEARERADGDDREADEEDESQAADER